MPLSCIVLNNKSRNPDAIAGYLRGVGLGYWRIEQELLSKAEQSPFSRVWRQVSKAVDVVSKIVMGGMASSSA